MAPHAGLLRILHHSTSYSPSFRAFFASNLNQNSRIFPGIQQFQPFSSSTDVQPPSAPSDTPSDGEPSLSHANVATLDDVLTSASVIESVETVVTKARVAPLPEDLSAQEIESANYVPPPPEKLKPVIPFPSFIKVQRSTRVDPQLLVNAIRQVKVMP